MKMPVPRPERREGRLAETSGAWLSLSLIRQMPLPVELMTVFAAKGMEPTQK